MIIDTHCHLNSEEFSDILEQTLTNAKQSDVLRMIVIGMYKDANLKAVSLSKQYEELYATVGIHPSYVEETYDEQALIELTKNKKVVAIGEIGIDLYWVKDNLEKQIEYFEKQIELSIRLNLPVVIHMRNSAQEIYDTLRKYPLARGVMHCFSEDISWANKFLDLGFYIGIGGPVTYKKNHSLKQVAREIPLDRLLIETDSPYLAPTPFRGRQNEPAYTKYVAEEIALLRGMDVLSIGEITTENAKRLFKLEEVLK
ncbi:MAG: TatD family hydrolase [Acholeplasma sp.]|nr:TatD family hydrolase [Acholeplasma sp.]